MFMVNKYIWKERFNITGTQNITIIADGNFFKNCDSVIKETLTLGDPPCKDINVRFTIELFQTFYEQKCWRDLSAVEMWK